ncbi:hypothetical protein LIER_16244 [Lithospermum erythrorhizon]|uniref:Myb/SANT-like domain-containing protein n=1 Tax=Lithospermum erythrorhizon TaxID=34254 RepID=A0AAV3Q8H1_LITER
MDATSQEERGPGKNKRKWTNIEDEKLIAALVDMVNIAYDMLNSPNVSGFGWDPTTNCLVAEKPVWDAYLQNRPRHATWKNKYFPFYDDFLANVDGEDGEQGGDLIGDYVFANTSPMPTSRNESSMRKNKKRIRSDDNLNIIKEAASIIGHEISKASLEFSKAIGVEAATSNKRQQINFELKKIGSLEPFDRIKVASQIVRDHEMTDLFFNLDENDREVMVMGILGGKF